MSILNVDNYLLQGFLSYFNNLEICCYYLEQLSFLYICYRRSTLIFEILYKNIFFRGLTSPTLMIFRFVIVRLFEITRL